MSLKVTDVKVEAMLLLQATEGLEVEKDDMSAL